METKIINNESQNTGTVIIENTGTQIIENSSTQIIENTGTQIIEAVPETKPEPAVQDNPSENNETSIKQLSGAPVENNVTVDVYKIIKPMGTQSGEADLYYAEKDSETVVFKYYKNNHKPKIEVVRKIKSLKSNHIVKLLDYGFYNGKFFEVYEYAKKGNLAETKKDGSYKYLPLSEDQVFSLCREIVESFNEFHQAGIIHRDIKPQNFFLRSLDPLDAVIGDFGIASVMEQGEELHKTKTGSFTLGYVPVEFQTKEFKGIGSGLDYYALGITLWELATGQKPFVDPNTGRERNENHILRDTCEGRIADDLLSRKPELSHKLQKLIRGLLVKDYTKRWGYSDVIRYLNGEDVDVAVTEIRKIKVSVLGKTYEDEKELASALWQNKNEVTIQILSKISDALIDIHSYIAEDVQSIVQDIEDKNNLEKPLLEIVFLLNPDNSFHIGEGYYISSKADLLDLLENAPEIVAGSLIDQESIAFAYISLILGAELTGKLKQIIMEETLRNKNYYRMSDYLFPLKIVTKVKLLLNNQVISPFISDKYKNIKFYELSDLENLDGELKEIIRENVEENIYEGDIIPWLEMKSGKRREELDTDSWESLYKSLQNGEK